MSNYNNSPIEGEQGGHVLRGQTQAPCADDRNDFPMHCLPEALCRITDELCTAGDFRQEYFVTAMLSAWRKRRMLGQQWGRQMA